MTIRLHTGEVRGG